MCAARAMNFTMLLKRPAAWLPLAMSLAAGAVALVHVAMFGATHEPDEGLAAHVFQLLMAAQVPVVVLFANHWLPRAMLLALRVLALQIAAAMAALAPVLYFNL